ncbi:MAG: hypothetical protein JWN86_4724, partial [Planctomycetota bacterium]|nr:hypothetical protein [Planctomycetota bacterium]
TAGRARSRVGRTTGTVRGADARMSWLAPSGAIGRRGNRHRPGRTGPGLRSASSVMEGMVASGSLVLPDGRCFAPRWSSYDAVLRAVADELEAPEAADLRGWLLGLLPGPADEEHVGYGPWYRAADGQLIERTLDLRELTPTNPSLICEAGKQAGGVARWGRPSRVARRLPMQTVRHGDPDRARRAPVESVGLGQSRAFGGPQDRSWLASRLSEQTA